MKKQVIIVFLSVCLWSCSKKIGLSGEIINQKKQLVSYESVVNNSSASIELDTSVAPNELLVTGDKSLVENLLIENKGSLLSISNKESISYQGEKAPLIIKMNNPHLQKMVIAGSGSIATNNITLTNDIEFHISGAGEVNVKLFNNNTAVFVTGAGDIRLRGVSNELKANMSGAGNLIAEDLTNKLSDIEISGAGNAKVNSSEEINIKISGVGNLDYKNHKGLKIKQKVSGIGSVNPY
ncbi:head GIN domain-containing protein [Paenimyroides aestuarii]|uniref:DUF2807 domain-containing protein n=1 Tax=Paenimyroides aestuarii TaxID=2968490 RepID=A0ABY5NP96_9FLAO|nr:head GIN domain-containing protein [Paenimyroides aestuarii]UUV20379.1 DUF2807 domain-containing protein [Paenimyroides aestuarii]